MKNAHRTKWAARCWHWNKDGDLAVFKWSSWRHAEVAALRKLWPSERRGVRIWSIRVTHAGNLALAKPCAACEAFMRACGVKCVFYSTSTGEISVLKL